MKSSRLSKMLMAFAMVGYIFLWGPIIVLCLFSFTLDVVESQILLLYSYRLLTSPNLRTVELIG